MKHLPFSVAEAAAAFLREQSGWREAQAQRFPGDDRNQRSAYALRELADHVAALPDDDRALEELVNAGAFDERGRFVATDEARKIAARFGYDWTTTPQVLLQELARATWRGRRPSAQKRNRVNATMTGEHALTENDRSTLADIFVLSESHSRKCFDAERAYRAGLDAGDHLASDRRGEWIALITDVHAAVASAALARVRAFGGIDLDGKLIDLKGGELEGFVRPLFVEAGIADDFLLDRRTYVDHEPTLGLRRDIAKWLRKAVEQMHVMDRVQWTPRQVGFLEELVRNARDSAEPIPSYHRPLDEALHCLDQLRNGASYSSELVGPIRGAIKYVLADVLPEDRIDSGTPWERSQALHAVLRSANDGDEWAVEVLKAHPDLAFFDGLTKKWVEQVDSGRGPGISAQRDRTIRTRAPER